MEKESYYPENNNVDNNNLDKKVHTIPNLSGEKDLIAPQHNISGNGNLLGVFNLLSMSWKMFLERWKSFLRLFFLLIVIEIGIQFLFSILIIPLVAVSAFASGQLSFIPIFAIFVIVFSVPSFLAGIAMIEIVKDKDIGVFNALSKAIGKIVPYAATAFIGGIALIGVISIFFILMMLLGAGLSYLNSSSSSSIMIDIIQWLFGFAIIILMFVVSIFFQVWIFFGLITVVLERMRPVAALSYSYELIKGKMLSIIWRFIVVIALFFLVLISMFIILSMVPLLALLVVPLMFVFYFIAIYLIFILNYNIYENLKAVKTNAIPEDFEARDGGKIKLLAISGAVIICLFLIVLIFLSSQFNRLFGPANFMDFFGNGKKDFNTEFDFNPDNANDNFGKYEEGLSGKKPITPEPKKEDFKNRDYQRKADLVYISNLLWQYKVKNGSYPVSASVARLDEQNNVVANIESIKGQIPRDPKEGYYYGYISSDGNNFELTARLEDLNSSDCDENVSGICLYRLKR